MASTRRSGQDAVLSPADEDIPSGRLERSTPARNDTLTPPCSTVRPSTKDSGMPSSTEPRTIASGAPEQHPDPDGSHGPRLQRLVDQLEGERADQQPDPERHHDRDDGPAGCEV